MNQGKNEIENLMRQAAPNENTKMDAFIFELGTRANKVEILHKNDSIEIKPKGWLDKKNWRELNEVLLRNGFEWLSSGRDSCWIKMKTPNYQSKHKKEAQMVNPISALA